MKPRRYSDPSDKKCCACGHAWAKPKRGKPIKAIPAHVWLLFSPYGVQFGAAYLSRPTRGAIAHAYASHFLGRSWSQMPIDYERAHFIGVRVKRFRLAVGR